VELRPGYKQTEVGVIPKDWEVKPLKEFAAVKGGKRLPLGRSLTDKQTVHPYIRVTDMRPGGVDLTDIKYVPDDVFPTIKNYRISSSDLFISVAGTLGIVGKIPPQLDGANLTENADKITSIACDQDFLLYNLSSSRIQSSIDSVRTVGAQPKLALGQIENFKIALPQTDIEQHAIAVALGDVDALIGSLEQLIAKKRDLKQATMQQLLTGKQRLSRFSGEWEVKPIGNFSTFVTKGATPTTYGFNWENDGVLFLKSECVSDKGLDLTQSMFISEAAHAALIRGEVRSGDILITITGNVGRVVHLKPDFGLANINQHIARIRVKDPGVSQDFVYHWLSQPSVRARYMSITTGQAYPQISLKQVRETQVPVPLLDEQIAIATVLSDMGAEITALEQRLAKTRDLKQGMMQELLTGRTRLV